ncbi:hypothetical protein HYS47_03200 [Candidatus Woesearchaeota archaeon]|nr:hypothetical protein [Candidatus Woesearchaeota archaeon]
MKQFAFRVSLTDMIRKLRYRYDNPIDYLGTFVDALYVPGVAVDIAVDAEKIELKSPAKLDGKLIEALEQHNLLAMASLLPPVQEYEEVTIKSGEKRVVIGADRKVHVHSSADSKTATGEQEGGQDPDTKADANVNGTHVVIRRKDGDGKAQQAELERVCDLYKGSDLAVTVQGKSETKDARTAAMGFDRDGFRGSVWYAPTKNGGIHYFHRGRFVNSEDAVAGVNICLYNHPFQPTVTKSRMITRGRAKEHHEKLQQIIPGILLDYLTSPQIETLRKESERSYQTLLRSIARRYMGHDVILEHVEQNLLFPNDDGDYTLHLHEVDAPKNGDAELWKALTGNDLPDKSQSRHSSGVRALALGVALTSLVAFGSGLYVMVSGASKESAVDISTILGCADEKTVGNIATANHFQISMNRGADFMTREELAKYLSDYQREINKLIASQFSLDLLSKSGYVRFSVGDNLSCLGGQIVWRDMAGSDTSFFVQHCDTPLPVELQKYRTADLDDKLDAVADFMQNNFKYDSIPPEVAARYASQLEAIATERRAVCYGLNSYAGILLSKLGVRMDVRGVGGILNGMPHFWLEVNEGTPWKQDWQVYDFSGSPMAPELAEQMEDLAMPLSAALLGPLALAQNNISMPGLTQQLSGAYDELTNHPLQVLSLTGGQLMAASLFLLGGLGVGLGVQYALRKTGRAVERSSKAPSWQPQGAYHQQCLQLRDLLGVDGVVIGPDVKYDGTTLQVPVDYVRANLIPQAIKLVPVVAQDDKDKISLYNRIVEVVRR